jgi:hypothetical protein
MKFKKGDRFYVNDFKGFTGEPRYAEGVVLGQGRGKGTFHVRYYNYPYNDDYPLPDDKYRQEYGHDYHTVGAKRMYHVSGLKRAIERARDDL